MNVEQVKVWWWMIDDGSGVVFTCARSGRLSTRTQRSPPDGSPDYGVFTRMGCICISVVSGCSDDLISLPSCSHICSMGLRSSDMIISHSTACLLCVKQEIILQLFFLGATAKCWVIVSCNGWHHVFPQLNLNHNVVCFQGIVWTLMQIFVLLWGGQSIFTSFIWNYQSINFFFQSIFISELYIYFTFAHINVKINII